ncbi:hypothetical protein K8T06_13875 [bacterium]|nr:hypothetical protein [bacterium]
MRKFSVLSLCMVVFAAVVISGPSVFAGFPNVSGELQIVSFVNGDGSGNILLEGNVDGCDALLVYSKDAKMLLLSFGPVAPRESKSEHIYCDLSDFSVKLGEFKSIESGVLVIESMHSKGKEGVVFSNLGSWAWTVDGDFEMEIYFGGKALGCFTSGWCSGVGRIIGPYCDPCKATLCCYENTGYIVCGEILCYW